MKRSIKKILMICVLFLSGINLLSCKENVITSYLDIEKITNIKEDFIIGMDASSVISLEESGVKYYDFNNKGQDVFKILSDNGINHIRVRVWNNPFDNEGRGYGGGNCDINTALAIGKRANKYNMKLIVDFHYSDFWADPGKQQAPKKWKNLSFENKKEALYSYTKESLTLLNNNNIKVGMVQIGNETNGALAGETDFSKISLLMNEGAKAVREIYPSSLVAVHFTNPEKVGLFDWYAGELAKYSVDYDVFGTSYYPYWHGTLENLSNVLNSVANKYDKKVMVLENSYAYTLENSDYHPNTISSSSSKVGNYEFSLQGQVDQVGDVIKTLCDIDASVGYCYWEGTWISVNKGSKEENKKVWEEYGSGWASSFAKEYDPNDAGIYYGGCAVENQAFFDQNGKALESLKLFKLIRK